jgi:Fe-S cluster assembly iron-binding protein IscA
MVSLTDGAVQKFKEFLSSKGRERDGIRIFLIPGG